MTLSFKDFQTRLRHIDKRHRALEAGYKPRVRKDGLIEMKPGRPILGRVPFRIMAAVLGGATAYKVFLLVKLGEADYAARLASLTDGTVTNQIGATILGIDPVTRMVTDMIRPLVG